MLVLYLVLSLLTLFYVGLMLLYAFGFSSMKTWKVNPGEEPFTKVTVVVPARNEEANILNCVNAIAAQSYPTELFEIIVVDDHSTDQTAKLIKQSAIGNLRLLLLSDHIQKGEQIIAYKKKAIEIAIRNSSSKLIVTTDADCTMGPNWLRTIANFYEKQQPKLIAAPVRFTGSKGFFQKFQALDFIGMIGLTAASVHLGLGNMSNGANLAYERAVFDEMMGFQGIDHLASGDDLLLMHKIATKYPQGIHFLKSSEAIVDTSPEPTVEAFIQQRRRWASKSAAYKDYRLIVALLMVLLFCISIVFSLIASIFLPGLWKVTLFMILAKSIVDFIFLASVSRYFGQFRLMRTFLISQVFHIVYIVTTGIWSQLGHYKWKGRQLR